MQNELAERVHLEHEHKKIAQRLAERQPIPAEPIGGWGLAMQYAKMHWQEYRKVKDVEYVLKKVKEDGDKKKEARRLAILRLSFGFGSGRLDIV